MGGTGGHGHEVTGAVTSAHHRTGPGRAAPTRGRADGPTARPRAEAAVVAGAVALAYAAGAQLAWGWFGATLAFAFFPPAGLTVAILLRRGLRLWPAVVAGVVVAEVTVDLAHGLGAAATAGYAAANALEPVVGAWVVLRLQGGRVGPPALRSRRGMAHFLIGAVGAGPLAGAVVGATVKAATGSANAWIVDVAHWWVGDGLAVLVVGAAVLTIGATGLSWGRRAELAGLLAVISIVGVGVLWRLDGPVEYLLMPLVWWAALRFDVLGVSTAGAALATVANVATAHERGPFGTLDASPAWRIGLTQLYVAVNVLVPWLFAIETAARNDAEGRQRDETDRRRGAELDRDVAALAASLAAATGPGQVASAFAAAARRQLRADVVAVVRGALDAGGRPTAEPTAIDPPDSPLWGLAAWPRPVSADGHADAALLARLGLRAGELVPLKRLGPGGFVVAGWAAPHQPAEVERRFLAAGVQVLDEALERSRLLVAERASAARVRQVFDTIDEGFAVCEMLVDTTGRAVDYRFVEVNPRFEDMTGLVDAVGHTAYEMVPDLELVWVDTYAHAAFDGEVLRFEQGSEAMGRWFEVFAMPVGTPGQFALVFKDQTVRRRTEVALRESERRFRTLADQLPLLVWSYGADGRLDWVNAGFAAFFGLDLASAGRDGPDDGQQWRPLTHPDDRARFARTFATAMAERAAWHLEVRLRRADGEWRWVESWAHPRHDPDGAFRGFLGTSADITERKKAEAALRRRQQQAELVATVLGALEAEPTTEGQAQRLAELLVPAVADFCTIEVPGAEQPLLALHHVDPAGADTLRALRRHHRLAPDAHDSVARVAQGEVQMIPNVTRQMVTALAPNDHAADLLTRLGLRSHLAVPLNLGGGGRGAVVLGRTYPERAPFDDDDAAFVRQLTERAGVVLAATRLRREEHDISVRLQQALLPEALQWQPNVVIEARYHAAGAQLDVGGDWYDTFSWPDGRLAVMVGDVVGHNLDSAATMGRLRAATEALAKRCPPRPAALLDALEQSAHDAEGTHFATAVCVVVEPATGLLTYASAGHPPVLVVGADGTVTALDRAQVPPIGAVRDRSWVEAERQLAPGDLVVMYSDGLVERRREPLDDGIARLAATARAAADRPIDEIADRLVAASAAHSPFEDDVVVACFRYTPVVATFTHVLDADAGELGGLRHHLASWMRERGVADATTTDVLIAVGEACTNAIEHAYQALEPDHIEVEVRDHRDHLSVLVRDRGAWRHPGRHNLQGGRGTRIMRSLSSHFRRATGPDGTTIVFTVPVPMRDASVG